MKKNYFKKLGIFIAVVVVCFYGCEQPHDEKMVPLDEASPPVQLVNKTLKFATVADYENYFINSETLLIPEFTSLAIATKIGNATNKRNLEEVPYYMQEWQDALILDLLDEDGMIIIDENLIFLDFENQIAALTEEHSLRGDLVNRIYDDNRILVFSFEDDVLAFIGSDSDFKEQKSEGTKENLRVMNNCPGSYPPGSNLPMMSGNDCDGRKCDFQQIYLGGTYDYRATMTHVYQAAAIYFRLKSELEFHRRSSSGGSWSATSTDMNITYWGSLTPNNRATIPLSGCYDQCQGCSPAPANKEKIQKIHHEASRRLTQYNLHGIFEYFTFNLGTDVVQLYSIQR